METKMPDVSSMMNNMGGLTILLTIIPVAIVVLILVGVMRRSSSQVNASKNWDSAIGKVLMSQIEMRRVTGSHGAHNSPYPVVVYEYEVMGRRFQGTRISFGTEVGGSIAAPRTLQKYPVGSTVTVFYNPQNPAEAVLEQSSRSNSILKFVVFVIIAMVLCSSLFSFGMMRFAGNFVNDIMSQMPTR
jgi:hypothetical protein